MNYNEALTTVYEYERSIGRAPKESWVVSESGGETAKGGTPARLKQREGRASRGDCIAYAGKCVDYLRFGYEVDACLAGQLGRYTDVMVRKGTPELLRRLGCSDLPMLETQHHLRNEVHERAAHVPAWHGLEPSQVKSLPELLETPCAVMDSLSERGGIVCMLEMHDSEKMPVIAPFVPDGMGNYQSQGIASNFIVSLYGKSGAAAYIARACEAGKLLYIDNERTESLLSFAGLQLPGACKRLDGIIRQSGEVGKGRPRREPGRHPMPKRGGDTPPKARPANDAARAARSAAARAHGNSRADGRNRKSR